VTSATAWRSLLPAALPAVCALALLASPHDAARAQADDLELYLTLEPSVISIDETASLTLEVRGAGFSRFQAEPDFSLENLVVLAGPHRSSSFAYTNGTTSRSLKYSWTLRAQEVGTAAVRGVTVTVRGQRYELPERTITVQTEPTGRPNRGRAQDPFEEFFNRSSRRNRRNRAEPEVFLRAVASPTDPYVGQQVTYTIYLFSQTDISSTEAENLPDFKGVWVHDVPQPKELRSQVVEIEGKRYGRVALIQKVLFPLRAGTIELEPAGFRLIARMPDSGFFGPLMTRTEPIRRRSNHVTIKVRDLPSAPAGYTGAVGDLRYRAELTPETIEEGDAATLVVSLEGEGHIQGLPAPELPELDGIRIYPPQQTSDSEVRRQRVRGQRTWSYVIVPDGAGQWEFPPLELNYFHPGSAAYRKTTTEPLRLTVEPGPEPLVAEVVPPEPEEAVVLPEEAARWKRIAVSALGALGLLVVGGGAWAGWRRIRGHGGGGESEQQLRRALSDLPEDETPRKVAAAIEDAWRDFLSDRWHISPGQPSTQWSRLLEEQGADPGVAAELVSLADDLHYLRYAPQLSSTDELRSDLVERSLRLAKALR